ncbi:hypothetical protein CXF83_14930 [Shewanella sp. Choline-02u-19]|uniref:hypothetical protein n=1 Tax=unclassified Shewanella TaxID=196818 RepID=UPI000C31B9FF|nr:MULTISPECIES: hypothetical protein [unclassified Shewanella]PKH62576.1 hypothetical protein CXF84_01000 [Shewanella sp. Bg11-22]PKI27913.1 hypothetical protein CXF83_14930 [Shewanella sp. Choline-02u-19]
MVLLYEVYPTDLIEESRAKLELDIDPLSERHLIMDRQSGARLYLGKNDINMHYFAKKYALANQLIVLILDDNGEYNAAVADGVKCELVNLVATP